VELNVEDDVEAKRKASDAGVLTPEHLDSSRAPGYDATDPGRSEGLPGRVLHGAFASSMPIFMTRSGASC
jgi:hypothetical protein